VVIFENTFDKVRKKNRSNLHRCAHTIIEISIQFQRKQTELFLKCNYWFKIFETITQDNINKMTPNECPTSYFYF